MTIFTNEDNFSAAGRSNFPYILDPDIDAVVTLSYAAEPMLALGTTKSISVASQHSHSPAGPSLPCPVLIHGVDRVCRAFLQTSACFSKPSFPMFH